MPNRKTQNDYRGRMQNRKTQNDYRGIMPNRKTQNNYRGRMLNCRTQYSYRETEIEWEKVTDNKGRGREKAKENVVLGGTRFVVTNQDFRRKVELPTYQDNGRNKSVTSHLTLLMKFELVNSREHPSHTTVTTTHHYSELF